MFYVAHRASTPAVVRLFDRCGSSHFEFDARLVGERVMITHFRPVVWSRGWLERDNVRLRVRGLPPYYLPIERVMTALPPGATIVFDPKDREPDLRAALVDALLRHVTDPAGHVVSTRSVRDIELFGGAGFRTWHTLDTPEQVMAAARGPLSADGVTVRQRSLTAAGVRALHDVTRTVVAWTVNRVDRAAELASFGVDGITTDSLRVVGLG